MPVYECSVESCPNQYTDGTPRNYMYCVSHRALEIMQPDAGADLEIKHEPDGNVIIQLTKEQIDYLYGRLYKRRNVPVAQVPTETREQRDRLRQQVNIAMKALEEIKSTAGIQTGPVGHIIDTISTVSDEALHTIRKLRA